MANRKNTARDLAQIAIFAALIAALGLPGAITVGSTGVPITLQTLGVMLAGGILGAMTLAVQAWPPFSPPFLSAILPSCNSAIS